jgi:hypothetical protein
VASCFGIVRTLERHGAALLDVRRALEKPA